MLENREGQRVPNVTFKTRQGDQWVDVTTDQIFKGKKVVLFAVPGAFTPTCSAKHLPGFLANYDALKAKGVDAVVATAVPRLHIASSTMDLSGLELELGSTPGRAFRLRDAIAALNENAEAGSDYTYVLIDCPPSLNLLTVNAMAASDAILVPLQCEFFALEGLSQLLQTVEQVRSTLNPNLSIHGIVLTMFDSRNNLSNQVVADVRQFMGSKVYNTMIPRNVRISEAPSYGKPVLVYDLKCVGSDAYLKLATEVIQRERELKTH